MVSSNEFAKAAEVLLARARECFGEGDVRSALECCRAAMTLQPACAPAFSDLLTAGLGPGDRPGEIEGIESPDRIADKHVREILASAVETLDPTVVAWLEEMSGCGIHPSAFEPLALLQELVGDHERARVWFRRHCLSQPWAFGDAPLPEHSHAYLPSYIDAIATDPDLPEPAKTRLLARLHLERGDLPSARLRLEQLDANHPSPAVRDLLTTLVRESENGEARLGWDRDGGTAAPAARSHIPQERRDTGLPFVITPTDLACGLHGSQILRPFAWADCGDLIEPRPFSRLDKRWGWVAPVLCSKTLSLVPRRRRQSSGGFIFEHLPNLLMKRVRQGRGTLLIDYSRESLFGVMEDSHEHFVEFLRYMDDAELPRERAIFLDLDLRSPATAAALAAEAGGRSPTILSERYMWFELSGLFRQMRRQAGGVDDRLVQASETVLGGVRRQRPFLCFNGMPRAHRWAVVAFLFERGLLDQGLVSHNPFAREAAPSVPQVMEAVNELLTLERPRATIEALLACSPLRVDADHDGTGPTRWALCYGANDTWPYMSTYFSVVTESVFSDGSTNWQTEKSIKPVANLHPFILIGDPGGLADLRRHGYRTFSPWIDERYDDIQDPRARMAAALAEVERLASMPIEALHDFYCECWPTLVHNYETFMDSAPLMAQDIIASIDAAMP